MKNTLKAALNAYDRMTLNVNDTVVVHHCIETECNEARESELLTLGEHDEALSGPSYSSNGRTTYYVGCGVIKKIFKNGTCTVTKKYLSN